MPDAGTGAPFLLYQPQLDPLLFQGKAHRHAAVKLQQIFMQPAGGSAQAPCLIAPVEAEYAVRDAADLLLQALQLAFQQAGIARIANR